MLGLFRKRKMELGAMPGPAYNQQFKDEETMYLKDLRIDPQFRPTEELITTMDYIPAGVCIKRIKPRTSSFKWVVSYKNGTEYYGNSIKEAFLKLSIHNTKVGDKYHEFLSSYVRREI